MFTRLRLRNWRNFTRVDVPLTARVFLVGPNASGKSNFLDALRFLHDIAKPVGGGLQKAVGDRGGVKRLRSLAARSRPDVAIGVGLKAEKDMWEYEVSFRQDSQGRPVLSKELVYHNEDLIISRPDKNDQIDPERLTETFLEQINANKDFRAVADFFKSIRYLHIVPQLIREPERSVGRNADPFGGDFLEQIAKISPKTRDSRLRRIKEALQIAVPQLKDLQLQPDERGTPHLRGLYEHWRPNAGWQTEEQFSDGTLRLLGLLWSLLDGTGPLLLEEPELSLHPEIVRYIPQMMARVLRRSQRQLLVSTHSRDLLEDEGIDPEEVLMILPTGEGSNVMPGKDDRTIMALLEGGANMADAVLPRTRPERASQLTRFGE